MKKLKNYKFFLSDMMLNMIGFGIYIFSQQILFLPIVAKLVNDDIYSKIVLYISILNVICNVTGGELGNVRLVRNNVYKEKDIKGDFLNIFSYISIFTLVIALPIFVFYFNYSIIGSLFLTITLILTSARLYSTCYYRLEKKYVKVIIQNIIYLFGLVFSLILFNYIRNIYMILFVPEFFSFIYAYLNADLFKIGFKKTSEIKGTIKKYGELSTISLLTNLMNYFDKFLIYPMFGAGAIAVYYAVNSVSKITSLISNPMSSVILAWVSNSDEKNNEIIIKNTLFLSLPLIFICIIFTIPFTYIALKILYSQFLSSGIRLIIPVAVASGFGVACSLIKSVLLKMYDSRKLVYIYLFYFIIFIILAFCLSKKFSIIGFAYANLISKIILYILFDIALARINVTKK